jgi:hypothetical protein
LNERWDAVRRGEVEAAALADKSKKLTPERADDLQVYRRGSLGEAFQHYRKMDEWKIEKAERTREDWMRGWKYIEPVFGNVPPRKVTATQISTFRSNVLEGHGEDAAFRAIKYWRALGKVAALNKYCDMHLDPSQILRNHAPEGRDQSWLEAEAWALTDRAWELGYYGLSAALGVMWDSQLSPVDVRSLTASQFATAKKGQFFFTDHKKTDKPVGRMLCARSADRLADYLEKRGAVLATNDFLFVNRSGRALFQDFRRRLPRRAGHDLYGPDEKRAWRTSGVPGRAKRLPVGLSLPSWRTPWGTRSTVPISCLRPIVRSTSSTWHFPRRSVGTFALCPFREPDGVCSAWRASSRPRGGPWR